MECVSCLVDAGQMANTSKVLIVLCCVLSVGNSRKASRPKDRIVRVF